MAPPAGEVRRFELPFTTAPNQLTNPELGLRSVAERRGENAAYSMDVTLLDAPDHRLIRAGILLAHRVVGGWGEWYLSAPRWAPLLPVESVEQMGHADLPENLANLVQPFRRGATLGPVAGLRVERVEYAVRGAGPLPLAVLRNEAVTVRRGGVATARYREFTLTGAAAELTSAQLEWLGEAMLASGATEVKSFPSLASRLGAPATGLTDLPDPQQWDRRSPLEEFVSSVFAGALLGLTRADLACRTGKAGAGRRLLKRLRAVTHQVGGLAPLLDSRWASELRADLAWAVRTLPVSDTDPAGISGPGADGVPVGVDTAKLNGERYLSILDRLAQAIRSPKLGDSSRLPTGRAMKQLGTDSVAALATACSQLTATALAVPGGPDAEFTYAQRRVDERWRAALAAAERLLDVTRVLPDPGKQTRKTRRRAGLLVELLTQCVGVDGEHCFHEVEGLSTREAFDAGREFERAWATQQLARRTFLEHWAADGPGWLSAKEDRP